MDSHSRPKPFPQELECLSSLLKEAPETLAAGNEKIQTVALNATKIIFDLSLTSEALSRPYITDLLSSLVPSESPKTRSQTKAAAEQKVSVNHPQFSFDVTPLNALFVDGMDEDQIWAQLDLRAKSICRMLDFVLEGEASSDTEDGPQKAGHDREEGEEEGVGDYSGSSEDEDMDMETLMEKYGLSESDLLADSEELDDWEMSEGQQQDQELPDSDEEGSGTDASMGDEEEGSDGGSEASNDSEESSQAFDSEVSPPKRKKRSGASSELDDGFFNLDEFNAYTERAEARTSSKGRLSGDDSDEEDLELDLFNDLGLMDETDDGDDAKELFYTDFFGGSSNTPSKSSKAKGKGRIRLSDEVQSAGVKPTSKKSKSRKGLQLEDIAEAEDNDEDDETHPLTRVKEDLFAEEDEETRDDLTTYERRMAALKEQIAELESENVGQKDWVLLGEAGSRSRPQNSLLEQDLEFDRVMKAVPVITEETVATLEEKIKARILEGRYDDVVRLRPLEDKPFLPSKFLELKDTKSSQSLAQIYENDYLASQGSGSVDDRDGKLKKEHDELVALWEGVCNKLDALCNAHFIPKQPKATISSISNVASTTLESALPTTKSASSMLAPQEIFNPQHATPHAKSELTPDQKRALRTKERKLKAKQRERLDTAVSKFGKPNGMGAVKKQKQAALESVVKHGKGVTVIGKDTKTKKMKHKG